MNDLAISTPLFVISLAALCFAVAMMIAPVMLLAREWLKPERRESDGRGELVP